MSDAYRTPADVPRRKVMDLAFPGDRHLIIETEADQVRITITTNIDDGPQRVDTHARVNASDTMKIAAALCLAAAEIAR